MDNPSTFFFIKNLDTYLIIPYLYQKIKKQC